jgi:shikimate kinase
MNLYLIGYRGCGKSTVAPLVAEVLEWDSLDSDEQVELEAMRSVARIFAESGENAFRYLETFVIRRIAEMSCTVVSLGGGVPTVEENRRLIRSSGQVVWLRADAEHLLRRIENDARSATQRPKLTNLSDLEEVRWLLAERRDVYEACADYTLDVDSLSPHQIADLIVKWWRQVDR